MPVGSAESWVRSIEQLTEPSAVHWCDGSDAEYQSLVEKMLADRTIIRLHSGRHPNSFLHRSHPSDVSRTEHLTYVCTERRIDAGPNNNWMDPIAAKQMVGRLFQGSMRGRTMYVIPYLMGPAGSPYSKVGIEVTDSPYVVISMRIMTRMGTQALKQLSADPENFCPGLHSLGDLDPARRFILHFPEEQLIWSIGSGYGGNALLGKKCFALRIASFLARRELWLAEHMLILGLEDPAGEVTYMAAAFPSACGKTNLAMMVSPLEQEGYKVWTVGDDIAWLHVGSDGRLRAINPESGFFGVVPGTSSITNPNALATIQRNTIFTNVALTPDLRPWWDGSGEPLPLGTLDWEGNPAVAGSANRAAHPNSRFTAPASQCPGISPLWEDPQGVPISAIIFGGRRSTLMPLVVQSFDWAHGVFLGATLASETTAAAAGKVGVLRRDPMAMLPFCGYNMGDYFSHWLAMEQQIKRPPRIFHVNWFRRGPAGNFLWPGFGQNLRVLRWILDQIRGSSNSAHETEIGFVPTPEGICLNGLDLPERDLADLLAVRRDEWPAELADQSKYFSTLEDRLPERLRQEHSALARRVGTAPLPGI